MEKFEKENASFDSVDMLMKHFCELSEMATKASEPEQKIKLVECMLILYDTLR